MNAPADDPGNGWHSDRLRRALLEPSAVALVGASATPGRLTSRPQRFLMQHGFGGKIFPINPNREEVLGLPSWPSLREIPEPVEHAYILLDTPLVLDAVTDCARAGVTVVSVLASDFAEAGGEGRALQRRLVDLASEAGVLLLGPNSMGVVNPRNGFVCTTNAAFAAESLLPGRLAVISQSGSLMGALLSRGESVGIGFSAMVSVGNEAQRDVGAIGSLLVDDPGTDAFLLFLETMRDSSGFAGFARLAHAAGKPVLAYVIGRSDEGQALSVSHTGGLTGATAAFDSFLVSCGVHRVDQFEALVEAPGALLAARRRGVRRPACVTVAATTGGGGAMVIDRLANHGVAIAGCSQASHRSLAALGIPLGAGKLVDVTLAGANYASMKHVVSTLACDPETGILVVAVGSSARFDPELAVAPIVDAVREAGDGAALVMAFLVPDAPESLRLLNGSGVPAFRTVESCAEAVACVLQARAPVHPPMVSPVAAVDDLLAGREEGVLDEVHSRGVFEALGIAGPPGLFLRDGAVPEHLGFDYPVVAKLVSEDLVHKSEAGIVALNLPDLDALGHAIGRMRANAACHAPGARVRGVLIQPMCHGVVEMLIGFGRDPRVGPVVTVGLGGIFAELHRDTSVRPAPIDAASAREMLRELRGGAILEGFRGRPAGDVAALAQAIADVSRLALHPCVEEAEINPLLVCAEGKGVVMLDALVRLGPPSMCPPIPCQG